MGKDLNDFFPMTGGKSFSLGKYLFGFHIKVDGKKYFISIK